MESKHLKLAQRLADLFAERPEVEAVAWGGSLRGSLTDAVRLTDAASDIDLYVYTRAEIPLVARQEIMQRAGGASRADLGLNYWGPGDEWFDAESGIEVDIVYFEAQWMEDQVRRVMQDHQPSLGYSTCFAFTAFHSQIFYDPQGWLVGLQAISQQPYPEELRANIVQHNYPVLRQIIPSYFFQLEKAVKRGDLVSVNHRLAGLLASYFDILFALNRQLHPGEKRLVQKAAASCGRVPKNMERAVNTVLRSAAVADAEFLAQVTILLDQLDDLLRAEAFHFQARC